MPNFSISNLKKEAIVSNVGGFFGTLLAIVGLSNLSWSGYPRWPVNEGTPI